MMNRIAKALSATRKLLGHRHVDVVRGVFAGAAMLGGTYYFGGKLHEHYPIQDWLFWTYAKVWLWVTFWILSCCVGGLAIVEKLTPRLPIRERIVMSLASGVYAFYFLQFSGGILHLFNDTWAILLPGAMLVGGGAATRPTWLRLWRHRRTVRSVVTFSARDWQIPVALFGIVSVALLYFQILTPKNTAFDSLWYHLGLPQGWDAVGAITRADEGWFYEALPNLAAVLYSWAFLVPKLSMFETVMVAAHMEFVLFIATLASIPTLVRWLVPRAKVGVSWVALFLFPSVYIYDASLHTGNDHIAAFFAVPIFLALRRAWKTLQWRHMVMLAICTAGALMTKYQAASLIVGPSVAVMGRAAYLGIRKRKDSSWLFGPAVAVGVGLILTSPLWLKNLMWYGDPLYPALHKRLAINPTNADLAALIEHNWKRQINRPQGALSVQLEETLISGFDHSFRSFSSAVRFHGKMPYFGSLFVLTFLWLPFVKGAKRTWGLMLAAQLGVFFWYYLSYVERYLQALVPWMAAAVFAGLVLAWRHGWAARIPAIAIVALQVIWGGDAYFFPTHAMAGSSIPLVQTTNLLASGFTKKKSLRDSVYGLVPIGDKLPRGATVLLHDFNPRLGLQNKVITDMSGLQGLIRYGLLDSPKAVHDLYKELGVTHLVWRKQASYGFDSLAGDLRFFEYAINAVPKTSQVGSFLFGPSITEPFEVKGDNVVLYAGCGPTFAAGVFKLQEMNVMPKSVKRKRGFKALPRDATALDQLVSEVEFVVYEARCKHKLSIPPKGFVQAATRRKEQLWVRRK